VAPGFNEKLQQSPLLVRVAPFFIFLALTQCQGMFGEGSRYWFYLLKTLAGAGMIWVVWPVVAEMRWRFTWEAWVVGVGVCVMWVGIDSWYPSMEELTGRLRGWVGAGPAVNKPADPQWNPLGFFAEAPALAWFFVGVRLAGSTLVVPFLEEVFYRSFVYRYLAKPNFAAIPLGAFMWGPFLITATVFGFTHQQWLAGILCGLAYQGLVCWKQRLDDVIAAHAITNFLLGLYVVAAGAWQFW
jgi:uncharacterized protein